MHLRGRERMYPNIYVALDNSEHSDTASTVALELASASDARIIGTHVYAARMHDYRFKQMEYTLPEEYQDEAELLRQRRIHDSLITTGLELISDSYTDVLRFRCLERGVPFSARMRDGRNWEEIVADVDESQDVDVVVMGALGTGAVKESQLGSVTELALPDDPSSLRAQLRRHLALLLPEWARDDVTAAKATCPRVLGDSGLLLVTP